MIFDFRYQDVAPVVTRMRAKARDDFDLLGAQGFERLRLGREVSQSATCRRQNTAVDRKGERCNGIDWSPMG